MFYVPTLVLLSSFARLALAAITLTYPFNSQVPPVARVAEQYEYVLPSNTFGGYGVDVVYSLIGNPSWLTLDTRTRTLSGQPGTADAGFPSFSIVAADSTGSAADPVVLVVTTDSGPYIAESLESQLQSLGSTDAQGALILQPNTNFTISFSTDTFANTGGNVSAYYGTSDNFTPLPSWISFNAADVEFTGQTPSVDSTLGTTQYFEFVLVGTDYPGFAGVSATFKIVLGTHQLAFANSELDAIANIGEPFSFSIPTGDLDLDGKPIATSNISSATANTTGSWLSFNDVSYTLSGTPSDSTNDTTVIAVLFTDKFGDSAATRVKVSLNSTAHNITSTSTNHTATVFTGAIPITFNATEGTFFSFTFNSSVLPTTASLNITIAGASWLHYNPANRTLYGEVPESSSTKRKRQSASTGSVTITATDGGQSQTQTVGVNVTSPSATTSASTPTTTDAAASPAATTTQASGSAVAKSGGLSPRQKLAIGLGIGVPLLLILLAILAFCCLRKRKSRSIRSASSTNISRPVEREKDEWPQAAQEAAYDEPRQLGAFQMFKSNSSGRLSGYAVEVNNSGMLAPPLAPPVVAHELPPLPESPGFEAVRSAYGSEESRSRTVSTVGSLSSTSHTVLSVNNSIGNVRNAARNQNTIKTVTRPRKSVQPQEYNRDSTNTIDSVSTDELFSVRLIGQDARGSAVAPPIARGMTTLPSAIGNEATRQRLMSTSATQNSAQTIGTYTSSEGDYIQRYGSQGESLSSGAQSRQRLSQLSRNNSSQPQPWRVMNSQDSYGSFGSYATTDSNLSDEFSFDESLSGESNERRIIDRGIAEESDVEEAEISHATKSSATSQRPGSDAVLLEAPLSPDWASPRQPSVIRRPTLNERVASVGKGKLMQSTARRPMSSASIGSPDVSADTETSAEIAFV